MSTCDRCKSQFTCAMADAQDDIPCWCTSLPILDRDAYVIDPDGTSPGRCFCPACLQSLLALQQEGGTS